GELSRISVHSKHQRHPSRRNLTVREIKVRPKVGLETKVLHIGDHAYDLTPGDLVDPARPQPPADRVFITKLQLCKRLAYDDDRIPIAPFLCVKSPASQQL